MAERENAGQLTLSARRGFTLAELLVAMVLLIICAVGMGFSTMRFSRTVGDSALRSRAQSLADVQLAMARSWPAYGSLEMLSTTQYNTPADGLTRATSVVQDTTGGRNLKRVTVQIQSQVPGLLTPDVVRSITISAP
jgi:prepilin-type N-terminal cleavage/methylation domain-containing protein